MVFDPRSPTLTLQPPNISRVELVNDKLSIFFSKKNEKKDGQAHKSSFVNPRMPNFFLLRPTTFFYKALLDFLFFSQILITIQLKLNY